MVFNRFTNCGRPHILINTVLRLVRYQTESTVERRSDTHEYVFGSVTLTRDPAPHLPSSRAARVIGVLYINKSVQEPAHTAQNGHVKKAHANLDNVSRRAVPGSYLITGPVQKYDAEHGQR